MPDITYTLCPACETERTSTSFIGKVCGFCRDKGRKAPETVEGPTRKPNRKVGLASQAPSPPSAPANASEEPYTAPQFDTKQALANPQAELANRTLARRRLLNFIQRFRPKYDAGWVHKDICRRLERFMKDVEEGKEPRLLLMTPPRLGKSEIGSRHFTPFVLGHHPDWEIIAASHTTSLSLSFSRYIRDLLRDPAFQAVFPQCSLDPNSQSTENWNLTAGGGYLAAGVGSAITGRGAHCFPAGTLVQTESEYVRIEHLVPKQKVLSYDHKTKTTTYSPIRAVQVSTRRDLYEIVTDAGRRIVATGDHPFYVVGKGYTEARLLSSGSDLLVSVLPSVRSAEGSDSEAVQELLLPREGGSCEPNLRELLNPLQQEILGTREVSEARAQRRLLFGNVQSSSSRNQECKKVRNVQPARDNVRKMPQRYVLLVGVQEDRATENTKSYLRAMRDFVSTARCATHLLLTKLCKQSPFVANARREELALQRRPELRPVVLAGSGAYSGERQRLCCLPSGEQPSSAPHQPQACGQSRGEPRRTLPNVPRGTPQISFDTVAVVRQLRTSCVPVYDIQVEGTNNFFAEEILVHNCLILDDLVKDIEAADSQSQRDAVWEWYISTAHSRLAPGGGVLGIMTSWSEDDWAGRIQQVMAGGEGDQFEIVRYPAINEVGDEYILADDSIVEIPPGAPVPDNAVMTRPHNSALHEARYTLQALLRKKANYIASGLKRMWDSLYQQNPTPDEGIYFSKEMFRYYVHAPHPKYRFVYQAWDFAISTGTENDWTVGVTIMQDEFDNLYVLDVLRFRSDDGNMIVDTMLDYHQQWGAQLLGVEDGQIWKTMKGQFEKRCQERKIYPAYEVLVPLTDKLVRANPMKGRMQLGKLYFPKEASWFPTYQRELLRFPAGKHDDQVDSTAWCVRLTLSRSAPKMPVPKEMKSWKDKLKNLGRGEGSHMSA